jgi:hypothetical protein
MNHALRRRLRRKLGRDPEPSAGIVDAQSVKTTGVGGEQRGFDGGKKVRSHKSKFSIVHSPGPVPPDRPEECRLVLAWYQTLNSRCCGAE